MDDIPLQKIIISGPTLASILQRLSSSSGDISGLLFGRVTHTFTSNLTDEDDSISFSPNILATITSFLSFTSTSFYDHSGHLHIPSLRRLISSSTSDNRPLTLIGWFSGRRRTPLRPSMRESSITSALSSQTKLSFQVENSSRSYTFSPCIFLLLSTPLEDQLVHTHEYRAYQFRSSTDSFEPKTLEIINIGPAFRESYSIFCPKSPFPVLKCELPDSSPADDKSDNEKLTSMKRRVSKDQRQLNLCAEAFEVVRLSRLIGLDAADYTAELEELYETMLAKLEQLARLVEKSSAKVLEQEKRNMRMRFKVAGLG